MATTSSSASGGSAPANAHANDTAAAPSREAPELGGERSTRRVRQFVNAMGPVETPKRAPHEARGAPRAASPMSERETPSRRDDRAVPEETKRRFVVAGNVYYFSDGARAFVDRGDRLTTRSENTEVIRSFVEIARARDWDRVKVTGTERFRRELWLHARVAGLEVVGHTPDAHDERRLAQALVRAREAASPPQSSPSRAPAAPPSGVARAESQKRTREERQHAGRLIDHGLAPYNHQPGQASSYFVKLATPQGEKDIWGVDLERAIRESLTRPQRGDEVLLRRVRREDVTVRSVERDGDGRVLSERPLKTQRNRWIIEKREFLRERAEAARVIRDASVDAKQATAKRPELVGTYMQLHAAAELAKRSLSDPDQQRRFVEVVRQGLADSVARGDPLANAQLRNRESGRAPAARPDRDRASELTPGR